MTIRHDLKTSEVGYDALENVFLSVMMPMTTGNQAKVEAVAEDLVPTKMRKEL
jgi:hypothetical protein